MYKTLLSDWAKPRVLWCA